MTVGKKPGECVENPMPIFSCARTSERARSGRKRKPTIRRRSEVCFTIPFRRDEFLLRDLRHGSRSRLERRTLYARSLNDGRTDRFAFLATALPGPVGIGIYKPYSSLALCV